MVGAIGLAYILVVCSAVSLYVISFMWRNTVPTVVFLTLIGMLASWAAGLSIGVYLTFNNVPDSYSDPENQKSVVQELPDINPEEKEAKTDEKSKNISL